MGAGLGVPSIEYRTYFDRADRLPITDYLSPITDYLITDHPFPVRVAHQLNNFPPSHFIPSFDPVYFFPNFHL